MSFAPFPVSKVSVDDAPIVDDDQVLCVPFLSAPREVKGTSNNDGLVHYHHFIMGDGVLAVYPDRDPRAGQERCAGTLIRLLTLVQNHSHRHSPVVCAFQCGGDGG